MRARSMNRGASADRVLVAGIGYRNLRDHSIGVLVSDRLAPSLSSGRVAVEDLSYGPIAVMQRLEDDPPDRRFARAVVVTGVARSGRWPGTIAAYRWDARLPPPDEIQSAVSEAVTGVISMDNMLIVCGHFGVLPPTVAVVEVEPLVHEFGEELSAPLAAIFDDVCALVEGLAVEEEAVAALPVTSLGGAMAAQERGPR